MRDYYSSFSLHAFVSSGSILIVDSLRIQVTPMNNSSAINYDTLWIDTIRNRVLCSWGIIYVVVGTIGTILNLTIFARQAHWSFSPCISYLFASSLATIPLLYVAILSRIGIGFQITPFFYIPILCKAQVYIANVSASLFIWFTTASFWDRYLSSSRNALKRNLSSVRNARRTIWIITLSVTIIYAQVFYCFEPSITTGSAPCSARNTQCSIVDTTLLFLLQFVTPPLLILYFGRSIYSSVHRPKNLSQTRDVSTTQETTAQTRRNKKADRLILRLVLIQGFLLLVCSSPNFIFRLYSTISMTTPKSSFRRSLENLIFNVTLLTFYFEKVCAFYVYILTNRHFRNILRQFFTTGRHRNTIAPQN